MRPLSRPAPRCAGQQPGPDQERLGHDLDGLWFLTDRDGQRGKNDWPAVEPPEQRVKNRLVEPVEALFVHLVQFKCGTRGRPVHHTVAAHLRVVADPAEQSVRDPGRAARAPRDLRAAGVHAAARRADRPTPQDDFELTRFVEVEVSGKTEPVTQRRRKQPGARRGTDQVNGAISSGIAVAPGPLPMTTSTRKSSIARYSISSAGRASR